MKKKHKKTKLNFPSLGGPTVIFLLFAILKPIDFTELHQKIDYVDHTFENVACKGGICEII